MNRRSSRGIPGALALIMLLVSALGTAVAQDMPIGRSAPHFRVQAESGKNRRGATTVSGYIYNDYGYAAGNIQLLVEGVDNQGRLIGKKVVPVVGVVPPFGRLSFEAPAPGDASSYRVSVYWYDWVCRGDG